MAHPFPAHPVPDIAAKDTGSDFNPKPTFEVADSSLSLDLTVKLAKYACAGIRRYWVADIRHRTIHDHRDPDRFGQRYRQLHSVTESALPIVIDGIEIQVGIDDLFGVATP